MSLCLEFLPSLHCKQCSDTPMLQVNTHIWSAVALESRAAAPAALPHCSPGDSGGDSGSDDVIDLAASPRAAPGQAAHAAKQLATVSQLEPAAGASQAAVQRCTELAGLLLQLHGVLVDGKLPGQAANGANGGVQGAGPCRGSGSRRAAMMQREGQEGGAQQGQGPDEGESEATPAAGSGRRRGRSGKQQTTAAPPPKKKKSWQHQNPPAWANKSRGGPSAGVGYGGDGELLCEGGQLLCSVHARSASHPLCTTHLVARQKCIAMLHKTFFLALVMPTGFPHCPLQSTTIETMVRATSVLHAWSPMYWILWRHAGFCGGGYYY